MRNKKIPKALHCVKPLIFLLLLNACTETKEGCRDIRATNYDVTADEDCPDDCCVYPSLNVKFSQQIRQVVNGIDTLTPFGYNTLYLLPGNPTDTFTIQTIKWYMSDFRLVKGSGEEVKITDVIDVDLKTTNPDAAQVSGDIIIFDAGNTSSYTLGTFEGADTYEKLKFRVGLQEEILNANPETADFTALRIQADSLNYEEVNGYIAQRYIFFAPPSEPDSTLVTTFVPQEVELTRDPFVIREGFDATLCLTVRYDLLFENITFGNTDQAAFLNNIVSNLSNALTLDSLEQN